MNTGRTLLVALALLLPWNAGRAEIRVWTSRGGSTVEAEWAGEEGGNVLLRKADGRTLGIALTSLCDADQAFARSLRPAAAPAAAPVPAATPAPGPAATNRMSLGGVEVARGDMITFLAPLPADCVKALKKDDNTQVTEARVGVAVPDRFDPSRPCRVLVVSATSDGNASSIDHARQYMKEALARGWVVMAADGPNGETPAKHSNTWRWSLLRAGLEEMQRAWPLSHSWSYATAGFSGGAKRSGYIAALLAEADYPVIGMFLGGCNQDMASEGLKDYGPKRSTFLRVPIFISNGTEDKVSTVQHAQQVRDSVRATGFKEVRLETYAGGHGLHEAHVDLALGWFEEVASAHQKP